jgi:plastocyanin
MFCTAGLLKLNPDELYDVYDFSPEQKTEAAGQAVLFENMEANHTMHSMCCGPGDLAR